jgi:hypothetical protein
LRSFIVALLFAVAFGIPMMPGQDKVAEGQYQMQKASASGTSLTKTATRWVLFGKPTGGYQLQSEIENQPAGMRVVQSEELTDHLVPTEIGYELYRRGQPDPDITARCEFSSGAVTCTGKSGKNQAPPCPPYQTSGPFWMWMEGLGSLDIPWLLGGAVNMAHLDKGRSEITTLIVSGGSGVMIGDAVNVARLEAIKKSLTVIAPDKPIQWGFRPAEKSPLEFIASEIMELDGTKVAVKHYGLTDQNTQGGVWATDAGFVVKLVLNEDSNFVLADYKQYKKLIPELQLEKADAKGTENSPGGNTPR